MYILGLHYHGDQRSQTGRRCGLVRWRLSEAVQEAGLEAVNMYKPLVREDEPYPRINETRIAPWVIYVLQKTALEVFR